MPGQLYRYSFHEDIDIADLEATLDLAVFSTLAVHGENQARLDAGYAVNANDRRLVIDACTDVGQTLNLLFVAHARQQFGDDAFRVERLECSARPEAGAA